VSPLVREFTERDLDEVVRLSLRAWTPVHASIAQAFGPELNDLLHPDWRISQERDVVDTCTSVANHVWVAETGGSVVGFVAVRVHDDRRIGEIEMLAVGPDAQNNGVGTALTELALRWIRDAGVPVAMVGTGADPGHAPARRTYEKAGLTLVPMARYFKKL
jgi:ribosomal protein S18 acetylase RimI-like enzyme